MADEVDDDGSIISSVTDDSVSDTCVPRRKKQRGRPKKFEKCQAAYKCVSQLKEDHGQPIFSCQFNWYAAPDQPQVFATVGSNRVTVYQCLEDGGVALLQAYTDTDPDENLYTSAWTFNTDTGYPILSVAGAKGVIRLLSLTTRQCLKNLRGHGQSINELTVHPRNPDLLLSVSKDHSLRLWNIKTEVCIAMFGGVGGHRDEVLSADFNQSGSLLASCGMDHALKIWKIDSTVMQAAIQSSYKYETNKSAQPFKTCCQHYPEFSTRDIHKNYVDCVRWFGNFLLSKSCGSVITCWKPGNTSNFDYTLRPTDSTMAVLHEFNFKDCEIWFVRFGMDFQQKVLAQGSQTGKVFVWDLSAPDLTCSKPVVLSHKGCVSTVRQCHFNRSGSILVCVCDDGTVWRWNKI